jgi:DNA ligase-1
MSEKLDGVRCFWTGTAMYSRNGNRFYPPKFFVQNWPKSQLDGELFIGRGQFSKTISAVKKNNPIDSEW